MVLGIRDRECGDDTYTDIQVNSMPIKLSSLIGEEKASQVGDSDCVIVKERSNGSGTNKLLRIAGGKMALVVKVSGTTHFMMEDKEITKELLEEIL